MSEGFDVVMVSSYTGEYARAFENCITGWRYRLELSDFEAGYEAAVGASVVAPAKFAEYVRSFAKPPNSWYLIDDDESLESVSCVIALRRNEAYSVAKKFAKVLMADAAGQYCGDDQHYDYFPDAMMMLHQLCDAIQKKTPRAVKVYNDVRQYAWDNHWAADEEFQGNIDSAFPGLGEYQREEVR